MCCSSSAASTAAREAHAPLASDPDRGFSTSAVGAAAAAAAVDTAQSFAAVAAAVEDAAHGYAASQVPPPVENLPLTWTRATYQCMGCRHRQDSEPVLKPAMRRSACCRISAAVVGGRPCQVLAVSASASAVDCCLFSHRRSGSTARQVCGCRLSYTSLNDTPEPQVVPFYQDADPSGPGARYRALVLDSSYRPIDVVSWQRAICLDLFDKVRHHWRQRSHHVCRHAAAVKTPPLDPSAYR